MSNIKTIVFNHPHRKKHFDFFNGMNHPHFGITAPVDVSKIIPYLKENKISTNLGIVYCLSRVANEIPELRWRIRENTVVEHQSVNPSFTVPTDLADVFSFCTVSYQKNARLFIEDAQRVIEDMRTEPSLEDEHGRDDYLFLSALPWIRFTGIHHAMQLHPGDSVPRISWGKFYKENGKTMMPLSIQVHHAVVDGRHVGQFYEGVEKAFHEPSEFFEQA